MSTSNGSVIKSFNGSTNNQCAQTKWEVAPWLVIDLQRSFSVDQIIINYLEDTLGEIIKYFGDTQGEIIKCLRDTVGDIIKYLKDTLGEIIKYLGNTLMR